MKKPEFDSICSAPCKINHRGWRVNPDAVDHAGTLKHYECYNEPHYERNIHYEFRGLLMPTALGALHKTSLLIHMPNA